MDDERIEHRITLDIDVRALGAYSKAILGTRVSRLLVPLETLNKTLQFDMDVRDGSNAPLAVTTSDEDEYLAHALLLYLISKSRITAPTQSVVDGLYEIVRKPSLEEVRTLFEQVRGQSLGGNAEDLEDADIWGQIARVGDIGRLMIQLASNYVLSTVLSPAPGAEIAIVKLRYVESYSLAPHLLEQLGLRSPKIYLPASGVGSASREHTRVVAPDGAVITGAELLLADRSVSWDSYGLRRNAERALIYTKNLPKGRYGVLLLLSPMLGGFFIPALASTFVVTSLLFFGAWLEGMDSRFSAKGLQADAAVAILVLLPSLLAAFFIRLGEHRLVARLHLLPRALVLSATISAVYVGAELAAGVSHPFLLTVFQASFSFNACVFIYLLVVSVLIYVRQKRVRTHRPRFPKKTELLMRGQEPSELRRRFPRAVGESASTVLLSLLLLGAFSWLIYGAGAVPHWITACLAVSSVVALLTGTLLNTSAEPGWIKPALSLVAGIAGLIVFWVAATWFGELSQFDVRIHGWRAWIWSVASVVIPGLVSCVWQSRNHWEAIPGLIRQLFGGSPVRH
ncbi:hypothetical protein [Schumannella luteola]